MIASAVSTKIGENKMRPAAAMTTSNTRLMIGPNRSALAVASEEVDALNWGPVAVTWPLPKSDLLLTARTERNPLTTGGRNTDGTTTYVANRSSCKCIAAQKRSAFTVRYHAATQYSQLAIDKRI